MSERPLTWSSLRFPSVLLATCGGSGLLRPAPGTWGSAFAAAVIFCLAVLAVPYLQWLLLVAALGGTVLGLWAVHNLERRWQLHDPGEVVIDEAVGIAVAIALVPQWLVHERPLLVCLLAFVWFRVFDILKPWPIGALDRIPGAVGVMADDLAAGLVAGALTIACCS